MAFCSTQEMLGDFFPKPLQGALFAQMWSKILNLPSNTSTAVHMSVLDKTKSKADKNDEGRTWRSNGSGSNATRLSRDAAGIGV